MTINNHSNAISAAIYSTHQPTSMNDNEKKKVEIQLTAQHKQLNSQWNTSSNHGQQNMAIAINAHRLIANDPKPEVYLSIANDKLAAGVPEQEATSRYQSNETELYNAIHNLLLKNPNLSNQDITTNRSVRGLFHLYTGYGARADEAIAKVKREYRL